ncbi:glycosyltransferase family 2 protein [Dokdonella sp. MW10]|uniref:glycosyltransferase family 2 protein n=1 Tax=Dokdonella sp. MW10 TaxID=2992926 RepID=UPI003F81F209
MSNASDSPRVAIVIPALNEERAIRAVVEAALAVLPDVIVIDDGSTDRTVELIADLPVTLIRHATPQGKGESLRDGFREALRRGFDAVVTMDGDGQHDAADIPRMLAAARQFPKHLVIGARMRTRDNQPTARRRANAVADWGISWGCGVPVADTQSGQRYYPRVALERVDLLQQGFVFEAAILIAATRECGLGVVSVPIDARYHGGLRRSHFRPVMDITRITWYTIWRVVHYGRIIESYRRSHGSPPCVVDPPLLGVHA